MQYQFPIINHIDDVIHAANPDYFMVAQRDGHKIINYLFSSADTFPDVTDENSALCREFRGLIFDDAGNLIRRPYHKFFNVGERSDTGMAVVDVSKPHVILEKLDGSMIVPYKVNGRIIWGTKMGDTDVAKPVHDFIEKNPNYLDFANHWLDSGWSPIFEWCSRQQRIVLDYGKEDQLILTAIRNLTFGEYADYNIMVEFANQAGIPVVKAIQGETLTPDFLTKAKELQDAEGFVIRFDSGHMMKIKGDWYCQLHRVKSEIEYERGVVTLLINEHMDDLKSMMPQEDLDKITAYENAFWNEFSHAVNSIMNLDRKVYDEGYTRKGFAIEIVPTLEGWQSAIMFKLWDFVGDKTEEATKLLKDYILKHCTRNNKFDELRKTSIFTNVPQWRGTQLDDE